MNQIIITKNFGRAEIIGDGAKKYYLKVKFLETGHIDEFRKDAVLKGEIRDKYAVTVVGVGIIGNIKTRGKHKPYYNVWKNMICRCYDGSNKAYYKKCIVSESWKTFENFYKDVPKIKGWNKEKFDNEELVLDKDLTQRFACLKIYSLETCSWVNDSENNCIQDAQQKKFLAISPNGEKFISTNITDFGRKIGIDRRQISSVLHKRFKSSNGWTFEFIDEEIV